MQYEDTECAMKGKYQIWTANLFLGRFTFGHWLTSYITDYNLDFLTIELKDLHVYRTS